MERETVCVLGGGSTKYGKLDDSISDITLQASVGAIENGCYVIAPDHLGHVYAGRSLAVDPYGRILLDMKKRQGIGYVNISLDKVHEIRKKLPLLKNRRTDIYSDFKI